MSAETPTAADIQEQIDDMLDKLYRVEESARIWRQLANSEDLRSRLYDIEQTTLKLIDDVCSLS